MEAVSWNNNAVHQSSVASMKRIEEHEPLTAHEAYTAGDDNADHLLKVVPPSYDPLTSEEAEANACRRLYNQAPASAGDDYRSLFSPTTDGIEEDSVDEWGTQMLQGSYADMKHHPLNTGA
jgi:hypothetical protein